MVEARCAECRNLFERKRYWQKFCSPACRIAQFNKNRNEEIALGRKVKEQQAMKQESATVKSDLFSPIAA